MALLEEFSVALSLLELGLADQPPMHWKFYRPLTGKQAVARNDYLPQCKVLTGIGPVTAKAPKVRDCLAMA